MSVIKEVPGMRDIPVKDIEAIVRLLGYDPANTSTIYIDSKTVEVEEFVRVGQPPTKILHKEREGYVKARIIHKIEGRNPSLMEEDL